MQELRGASIFGGGTGGTIVRQALRTVVDLSHGRAPSWCITGARRHGMRWRVTTKVLAQAAFRPRLRVFVVRHGFLLIIRGFVKFAVCNMGVTNNENNRP